MRQEFLEIKHTRISQCELVSREKDSTVLQIKRTIPSRADLNNTKDIYQKSKIYVTMFVL